jgi:hypothetical protein
MLVCSSNVSRAAQQLHWRTVMTIGQPVPRAGLAWGMSEPQLQARYPHISHPLSDAGCTFDLHLTAPAGQGLSEFRLAIVSGDAHKCALRALSRLNGLYGHPDAHQELASLDKGRSPLEEFQYRWLTPSTCAYFTYNPGAAASVDRLWVSFGSKKTDACGYDDQVVITSPPAR